MKSLATLITLLITIQAPLWAQASTHREFDDLSLSLVDALAKCPTEFQKVSNHGYIAKKATLFSPRTAPGGIRKDTYQIEFTSTNLDSSAELRIEITRKHPTNQSESAKCTLDLISNDESF